MSDAPAVRICHQDFDGKTCLRPMGHPGKHSLGPDDLTLQQEAEIEASWPKREAEPARTCYYGNNTTCPYGSKYLDEKDEEPYTQE